MRARKSLLQSRSACWIALLLLVMPMFASFFFDDMFSSVSYLFEHPEWLELGWSHTDYGFYASGYSVLCVFGGLIVCGLLLDKWGARVTGSVFVTMMVAGGALVYYAITSGVPVHRSLQLAYMGNMLFGLGSEIAGTTVTRSIAKWFKGKSMALAMALELSISRLGTAFALVMAPLLVVQKAPGEVYSLAETASPALFGLVLMFVSLVMWAVFVAMDARFDRETGLSDKVETADSDLFRFSDVLGIFRNKSYILVSLLCMFFYSSVVTFKKFAGAILIPRFDMAPEGASWMISMVPFATVVFAPLFGIMIDRFGKATRWMLVGAVLTLVAHLMLAFAPQGVPFWGYFSMVLLGVGYSLVPAALWPSVPRIVPEKVLGTGYAMLYWIQNVGLMLFKIFAGMILESCVDMGDVGPVRAEYMFLTISIIAFISAVMLRGESEKHPEFRLDAPNK